MVKSPIYYNFNDYVTSANVPSVMHVANTQLTKYYQRYLLQKIMSVIDIEGMPDEWDRDYFYYTLLLRGYIAIVDTREFGVIPQECNLRGRNVFYRPTNVIVTNPLITNVLEPRIDEECALIKLMPDYGGIADIVGYYADMLSLTSQSIGTNLINSKFAQVFAAENKNQAESFKEMVDRINAGEPAVFIDKSLFQMDGKPNWQVFTQSLAQNYIGSQLIADLKKIELEFDAEIGLPNANFEKSSHLLEDEVNSNNISTQSKLDLWLDTISKGLDKANELFGLGLSAKARYDIDLITEQEVEDDGESNEDVDSRSD